MSLRPDPSFYSAEAALPPDAPSYVERAADADLLQALRDRRFAIMLSSRKVGKSSLLEHTFSRLRQEGVLVAKKELASAGPSVTEEGWYLGIVLELVDDAALRNQFVVAPEWRAWWTDNLALPAGQRFIAFLRTFFLSPSSAPWVIAVDEIDTTIPLSYSDDFFAALRSCQNARAADPLFRRLTFLLVGVASPAQLIKNNARTPFNVGHAVGLTDFTAEEAKGLLAGLGLAQEAGHPALEQVLYWTGGHPFLTQSVFLRLATMLAGKPGLADRVDGADWVALVREAVHAIFVKPGARTTVAHFHDIARRRIGPMAARTKRRTLAAYQRALAGRKVKDDALIAHIVELKLSGLLVCDPKNPEWLMVHNRIYRAVFDEQWVREEMPANVWQLASVGSAVALVLAVGTVVYQEDQAERARIAELVAQIEQADADVPMAAFGKLKATKGQEQRAVKLLGQYWANKARVASVEAGRDSAALLWLKALTVDETPVARLQAREALAGNLPQVAGTFRYQAFYIGLALSPDGSRLATSNLDQIKLWDTASGSLIRHRMFEFVEFYSWKFTITRDPRIEDRNPRFSADGRRLIARTRTLMKYGIARTERENNSIRLWDVPGLSLIDRPSSANGVDLAFSPDGLRVLTANTGNGAQLWDASKGGPFGKPMRHPKEISFAIFSQDGRRLATADGDGTVRLWDGIGGQPLGVVLQHRTAVKHMAFSPDGRRFATTTGDQTAQLWDLESGHTIGGPLEHQGTVNDLVFSPDGQRLATASADKTARLWDAKTGNALGKPLRHQGAVVFIGFMQQGRQLITADKLYTVTLWDVGSGEPQGKSIPHLSDSFRFALPAASNADGRQLATIASNGTFARLWHLEAGKPQGKRIRNEAGFQILTISQDAKRLATVGDDNSVRIWSTETGQALGQAMQHQGEINSLAFSPDGTRMLSVSADNTARLWDANTGQPVGKSFRTEKNVRHVAFSPDGQRFAFATTVGMVQLWNVATGEAIGKPFAPLGTGLRYFSFSPDSRLLAVAGRLPGAQDKTVGVAMLWDIERGIQINNTITHGSEINHVAFSPDGLRLATSSDIGSQLWRTDSGERIGPTVQQVSLVQYSAFSQDGHRLITKTAQNLTWFAISSKGDLIPEKTVWANAGNWVSNPVAVDPSASTLRIAEAWGGDPLIRTISLTEEEPGLPALPGTPAELLKKYQHTFALRFEDEQKSPKLVPTYGDDATVK